MPQYEVEVKISEVNEPDALAARLYVEERLRSSGLKNWRVVTVSPKARASGGPTPFVQTYRPRRNHAYVGSALLVAAVLAWVLWFLWVLTG
ncbi:MAG: hypothetical protein KatS3mg077_2482 [Candidatus Binatia bacterium]|nr:MAG: hypothetical protein KatS3mg077_2482 [Candidatus Binatia bacterium]